MRRSLPEWLPPALATLTDRRDLGPEWDYERKLDGIRGLAFVEPRRVRLLSRNHLPLDYPEVVVALEARVRPPCVVDGEIVAFSGRRSGFAVLQQRHRLGGRIRFEYHLFDVLHAEGRDVRPLPLSERRQVLRGLLTPGPVLKTTTPRRGDAARLLDPACAGGWEGLIAKRVDAPYPEGRSKDWLKLKCSLEQEFVVGGYTDAKGSRAGFGALLLGYHDETGLRYAGDVGTGFDRATLASLAERLLKLETEASPFVDLVRRPKDVHFVRPKLVAQVGFSEWTHDGRLRHPRFLGLRADKPPAEVVREAPA